MMKFETVLSIKVRPSIKVWWEYTSDDCYWEYSLEINGQPFVSNWECFETEEEADRARNKFINTLKGDCK